MANRQIDAAVEVSDADGEGRGELGRGRQVPGVEMAAAVEEDHRDEGARNYFRVTAVSTHGVESPFSNEESLVVNLVRPGGNQVLNGDSSAGSCSTRSRSGR